MSKITTVHHKGNKPQNKANTPQNIPEAAEAYPLLERKRVAAYCRVSTLQEEQDQSYEAQQRYYKTLFENDPKHILIGVYGDEGISGRLASKRPGFMDLMRDCKYGRIDEIYTRSISRFARNYSECVEYVRELKKLGIVVHFEKENFTTDDLNIEMLLSIMAIMAQEESNSISQNITLAHEYRNKKGDPIRRAVYGYNRDRKATDGVHQWRIKKDEAERVRMVYSFFLDGYSQKEIADKMREYEQEHGETRKWSKYAVCSMLTHEAYIGDLVTAKSYTVDYLNRVRKENKGEKEQQYLKNHHPAIISREDFAKVHRILGRNLPECMQ